MPETTPLIKAALNLRVGAGFDVYNPKICKLEIKNATQRKTPAENQYDNSCWLLLNPYSNSCFTYFALFKMLSSEKNIFGIFNSSSSAENLPTISHKSPNSLFSSSDNCS